MTITATDQGSPQRSSTALVTIDVDRNLNPPVFRNLPAVISIPENQGTGINFFTANATDADTVVSKDCFQITAVHWEIFAPVLLCRLWS